MFLSVGSLSFWLLQKLTLAMMFVIREHSILIIIKLYCHIQRALHDDLEWR